jgi:PAS domain S-box-containing protein
MLTEDDRTLLEGLCGQIAISLESTRLRQAMQERLDELNNLYKEKSREGWAAFTAGNQLPAGYLYDRLDVRPAEEIWVDEIHKAVAQKNLIPAAAANSATVAPLTVRGEVVGALGIYADQEHQLTGEDLALIEQVSDQVALALDSARLFEQTSVALDEAEKLYNFSRNLAEAADLDGVVAAVVEAAGIPAVCRGLLITFDYNTVGDLIGAVVKASWFSGLGESQGIPVGTRYERSFVEMMRNRFVKTYPMLINQVDEETRRQGIYSMAVLPLWVGSSQVGVIMLQTDMAHEFSEDERRPLVSLAQQAAITIQSRLLFDQVTSSEARFRDISMSSADWVWELDAQGRYTFCSERVKDVLGYTATEMLGKTPYDLMPSEGLESVGKILSELIANKVPVVDLENHVRAKNGQERIMMTSGVPVLDDQGNLLGYRGVDRDITERKALEAAVLKDRAQLAEAMEAARMASWEFDNKTGTFIFNDAYYRFLETSLEEEESYLVPAAVYLERFVHPEDVHGVEGQIRAGVETQDPNFRSEFEARLRKPDGAYRYALVSLRVEKDAQGKTVRMFGTNQDITERKQAQETIAKRAVELATVAEITTRVSTIQNPDEMLQTAVDLTKQVFNLYHVHIYLLNESATSLAISKGAGEIGRKMVQEGREIDYEAQKSLVARAARSRQGVIVNNVKTDPDFLSHPLLPDTRSEMAVPMIGGGRLLGVIDVQDTQIDRFTPEDVNIMTTLAAQIAVSLQNARSYARAQRQAEREALINAISERIQATNSVENALQVAVREIGRALGAQHTAIRLGLERKTDGE